MGSARALRSGRTVRQWRIASSPLKDMKVKAEEMSINSIDVLIRGAKVVDGTGNPWFYGDMAIQGDRVLEIAPPGRIPAEAAREVVDAEGMVVCPGFIDILSHSHIP